MKAVLSTREQIRAIPHGDALVTALDELATAPQRSPVWCGLARWFSGKGSPAGVIVANVGDLYSRTDGGTTSSFYVKESGNGLSTGWVAK